MTPKRRNVARRDPQVDELFCFSSWTPDQLAERYGSLEEARRRHDHLVAVGVLKHPCWAPNALAIVDVPDREEEADGHRTGP